jgi:hypothetical protein
MHRSGYRAMTEGLSDKLTPEEAAAVARVIERTRRNTGLQVEDLPRGKQAYACTRFGAGIHWGVTDPRSGTRVEGFSK